MDPKTAILAALIGGILLAVCNSPATAEVDARTAREIAVLSRVLEKRLSHTRQSLEVVATPRAAVRAIDTDAAPPPGR